MNKRNNILMFLPQKICNFSISNAIKVKHHLFDVLHLFELFKFIYKFNIRIKTTPIPYIIFV